MTWKERELGRGGLLLTFKARSARAVDGLLDDLAGECLQVAGIFVGEVFTALARLFGAGVCPSVLACLLSGELVRGRCVFLWLSAVDGRFALTNDGAGKGGKSAEVEGRLLLFSRDDVPRLDNELPGRLNGSSRRGGIIKLRSSSSWATLTVGAVEGRSVVEAFVGGKKWLERSGPETRCMPLL